MTTTSDVQTFLARSLAHADGEYDCDVLGRSFRVHPQVMSPQYSYSPTFVIRHWDAPALANARVLDMGCGCGVLAVFAALAGAARVVAVDINPHALAVTRHNVAAHGVGDRVEVVASDAFAALDPDRDRFDHVVFNAPYFDHPYDPDVPLTRGVFDPDHEFLRAVLDAAPRFLAPGGDVIVALGSTGLTGARADGHAVIADHVGLRIVATRTESRGHLRTLYVLASAA